MKRLLLVVAVEKLAIIGLLIVALDVRLHHTFEKLGGLNLKGYRGHVAHAKQPGELRIAVVGGSFAYGWGVAASETFSGYLGRLVTESFRTRTTPPTHATDVNLAGQGIAPDDYLARIRHFAYLKPDVICIVPDRSDSTAGPAAGMPERSGIFALTGYMPILPVILKEKGYLLQAGRSGSLASRLGGILLATGQMWDAADAGLLSRVAEPSPARRPDGDLLVDVVKAALEASRDVVVVAPPRRSGARVDAGAYGDDPRVHVVDLEALADLREDSVWINNVNLGAGGNSLASGFVVPTVLKLVSH